MPRRTLVPTRHVSALVLLLAMILSSQATSANAGRDPATSLADLAVPFVRNVGQLDPEVVFSIETLGGGVFVTRRGEIVYSLAAGESGPGMSARLRFRERLGCRSLPVAPPRVVGGARSAARVNVFNGSDPDAWYRRLPTHQGVDLGERCSGTRVTLLGEMGNVEKIVSVQPGADPTELWIEVEGIDHLSVDEAGRLVLETSAGDARFSAPIAFQEIGGSEQPVEVRYVVAGRGYGFEVGSYDPNHPLTIDPTLVFGTYLGGSEGDGAVGMTLDDTGEFVYLAGIASSTDFPVRDAWSDSRSGPNDAFVAKLATDGSGLVYSTYLGGSSFDDARSVALDNNGNVYVTGVTFSNDFPAVGSSTTAQGQGDAYLARLDTAGQLTYARYLGGAGRDEGKELVVAGNGDVVLVGGTGSSAFPVTSGAHQITFGGGSSDAFVTRLSGADPEQILASTYFGGPEADCAFFLGCTLAIDATGDVVVAFDTRSENLSTGPTLTSPIDGSEFQGGGNASFGGDAFVVRLDPTLAQIVYSTYLGGQDWDEVFDLALDSAGGVHLVGDTASPDFPVVQPLSGPGAFDGGSAQGGVDVFAASLAWSGTQLSLSFGTYLGGSGDEHGASVSVGSAGEVWLVGSSDSVDFPQTQALQPQNRGRRDVFVAGLTGAAPALDFASYLGGADDDGAVTAELSAGGDLFVAGNTRSIDFPIARPYQATAQGGGDAFLLRLDANPPNPVRRLEDGYLLSPRGTLRVLLVFAEIDDNAGSCTPDPPRPQWPAGGLPPDADEYFDAYVPAGEEPEAYLTRYYDQASLGQFLVLGDYYPEVVTVPCSSSLSQGARDVIDFLDGQPQPLETASTNPLTGSRYTLDDFDLWGSEGPGLLKSGFPDGTLDAVVVLWRNHPAADCGSGLALWNILGNDLHDKRVVVAGSYMGCQSGQKAFRLTVSEIFHALFGGNQWHTGSGAGYHTFNIEPVGSYSTTQGLITNTAAAWDRFSMHWWNPDHRYLLSALGEDLEEVPSDIDITSHPDGVTLILPDYYSTGSAVRIRLPHFGGAGGTVKNQYLWLENHQLLPEFEFDRSDLESVPGKEPWVPGLYVQLQVGKDQRTGDSIYSLGSDHPNGLASWLLHRTAEGNYDFMYRFDRTQGPTWEPCNWQATNVPIDREQSLPNPLTGFSDVYKFIDSASDAADLPTVATRRPYGDGMLHSDDPIQATLSEIRNGQVVHNCHFLGDSEDAFRLAGNSKLGLGTNPPATPVVTHRSDGAFGEPQPTLANFENRRIRLNNLSIEILEEDVDIDADSLGDGALRIAIRWDDPRIEDDVRWTGDIVLQEDAADPMERQSRVVLAEDRKLCLDRGLSATRDFADPEDRLFTDPTVLTIGDETRLHLEPTAALTVLNRSRLVFEPRAELQIDPGATIHYVAQPGAELSSCDTPLCASPPPGMVGWWSLDETEEAVAVDRAGTNHGLHVGEPEPVAGRVAGALRFEGSQRVVVPDRPSLDFPQGAFSVDLWFETSGPGMLISKHDNVANRGYEVFLDIVLGGNSPVLPVGVRLNGHYYYPKDCDVPKGEWTHLAIVVDPVGQTMGCFVDGVLRSAGSVILPAGIESEVPLMLGSPHPESGSIPLVGRLDEVELFDRPLAGESIRRIFEVGAAGKCRFGCRTPPSGLVAWWPFDDLAGTTAFDLRGQGDGTRFGTGRSKGPVGGALELDGIDDYVEVQDTPGLDVGVGDFSIDFWLRTNAASGVETLLDKRTLVFFGTVQGYSVFLSDGVLGFQMADGGNFGGCSSDPDTSPCTNYLSDASVADGEWHFVAISVDRDDPTGGRFYVDGLPAGTFDPTLRDGSLDNSAPLRLGTLSSSLGSFVAAELDEVELYDRPLDEAEVVALATAPHGKCKGTVAVPEVTSFCQGQTAMDVPVTVCNDASVLREVMVHLQGLPGGDPVLGQGCNVDGPTELVFLGGSPVSVPAMSCVSTGIRIKKPVGLDTSGETACYEAVTYDLESGVRQRAAGVLRDASHQFCIAEPPDDFGDHSSFLMLRPGKTAAAGFDLTNDRDAARVVSYTMRGQPAESFRFDEQRPGQPVRGELLLPAGASKRLAFKLQTVNAEPADLGQVALEIDGDPIPVASVGVRVAPRGSGSPPPAVALGLRGDTILRAGGTARWNLEVRNVGSEPISGPLELIQELPDGLRFERADSPGWRCRPMPTASSPAAGSRVRCRRFSPRVLPAAGVEAVALFLAVDYSMTPGYELCAHVDLLGDVDPTDDRLCAFAQLELPPQQADTGDAPDSTNHTNYGTEHIPVSPPEPPAGVEVPPLPNFGHRHFTGRLYAYGNATLGNFPTVFDPATGEIQGPIHWEPETDSWLGRGVSGETDADLEPDEDSRSNLDPLFNHSDGDGFDDGVRPRRLRLRHCQRSSFEVDVTIVGEKVKRYLNVWFDFDRDADWDDAATCRRWGRVRRAQEWAVRNHAIELGPGTHRVRVPRFWAANPQTGDRPLWMRITLADQPAPSPGDGRGPERGYRYGETEDYLLGVPLPRDP